jgi:PKD repeat protein
VTATAGTANGTVDVAVSAAPNVTLEVPTTGIVGIPVAMSIAPQGGGSGNTSPRQLANVVVNFGDGQAQTFTNITGTTGFTHTYDRPNGYTVSATATDVVGNTGNTSKAIVITRSTPGATVSATPSSGAAPLNSVITVGATASNGAPPIESVRVTINGNTVFTSTSGGTFAYRFDTAGNYVIEAFVTDAAGTVGRATNVVVVN